jgi:uncharacterized oxidoreductase
MQVAGKTIIITGSTDGIGYQLALQLKAKGATVIGHGRNPERIAKMRSEGFEVIGSDLSSLAGVEQLLSEVQGRDIDILVNNAGAGTPHDFREGPPDSAHNDSTIFLNLNAPIRLITAMMPMLRSRPEAMIVNVTSGLAIAPRAGGPVYCATKAALRSYSQAIRYQLRGSNVHLLDAMPPVVATALTAGRYDDGKKMAPDECARQIISAMERNAWDAKVGIVKLLSLVHSISPALARKIMIRF